MDKIIFLDFDGVLTSKQSIYMNARTTDGKQASEIFCPIAMSNLNFIMEEISEIKIVISSSRRVGRSIEELRKLLGGQGFLFPDAVMGITPTRIGHRESEITEYINLLSSHKGITSHLNTYVILDDWNNFTHLKPYHVWINPEHGLMMADVWQVLQHFSLKNFKHGTILI